MKKNIFLVLAITIFTTYINLNGVLCLNDIIPVFPEPEKQEINSLVIEGAAGFFASYSDALLVMKEYELSAKSTFNISTAAQKTGAALYKLEESRACYAGIVEIGEKVEYVEFYRSKLMNFNYENHKIENNLNDIIANEVSGFLKTGDVLGLFNRHLEKVDRVIATLKDIKNKLDNNIKPGAAVFWNLLQDYSEIALFGNYATIFSLESFGG